MSNREFLAKEAMIEPEPIIDKMVEYLRFLKAERNGPNYDSLLLSLPTLANDWLSPEEEEAWKDYQ